MLSAIPLCLINRHSPDRRQVVWDGSHYTGHCRHCGAPIWRKSHNNWKKQSTEDAAA